MSLDPILWALKDAPVADSLERLVLVTLGERAARADGCTAFPSRDTLAATVLADPKTVQRVLQRLVKRGLIAKGDQSAARYIRADRRPVVYDLLIPYSWFPNPERMNAERRQAGLPPLTPEDRPDIAPPPARARRSDVGRPRKKKAAEERGDSESPRPSDCGGTDNPARGDCQSQRGDSESPTGGLSDPRTSSLIRPLIRPNESLSPPPVPTPRSEPAPATSERETFAPPNNKPTTPTTPPADAADRIITAYTTILGRPLLTRTRNALRQQAAEALASGYPEEWLTDRARELAVHGWTDLAKHVEKSTVPLPGSTPSTAASNGLPPWCGECGNGMPARLNIRFRRRQDGTLCHCHPDAARQPLPGTDTTVPRRLALGHF